MKLSAYVAAVTVVLATDIGSVAGTACFGCKETAPDVPYTLINGPRHSGDDTLSAG